MDDLPELPFEKVLSYLSLEDRLKARAVSRRWYHLINIFKVKTLCYSQRPTGFIMGKRRLVSGAFAQNFISSTRFELFFTTLGPTILSNLKHLRLCDLRLTNQKMCSSFAEALQSFGQLEELDIIRLDYVPYIGPGKMLELTLPMLTCIRLEVRGISRLYLDAQRLVKVKIPDSSVRLNLVHAESVEWFVTGERTTIATKDMKNLKYLYLAEYYNQIDSTFLSNLEQLKEIHLLNGDLLDELFEQKQRYGRTDLKIYFRGLLLNGPDDPAINSLWQNQEILRCLAENPSRLVDQIPCVSILHYTAIERVAAGTEMSLVKRFADLTGISVTKPVQDTERFLNLLKNLNNIERLWFLSDQPQDLFDRLPEHRTVQTLSIRSKPADIRFLFRLKHIIRLSVGFSVDAEAIRKIFEGNEFLSRFEFNYLNEEVRIEIEHPKQFKIWVAYDKREVPDLDAAIESIFFASEQTKCENLS